MLLVQIKKVLPSNTYVVLGKTRTFGNGLGEYFDIFFAGPAKNLPDRYDNYRIASIYLDRNVTQVIELEVSE